MLHFYCFLFYPPYHHVLFIPPLPLSPFFFLVSCICLSVIFKELFKYHESLEFFAIIASRFYIQIYNIGQLVADSYLGDSNVLNGKKRNSCFHTLRRKNSRLQIVHMHSTFLTTTVFIYSLSLLSNWVNLSPSCRSTFLYVLFAFITVPFYCEEHKNKREWMEVR